MPYTAEQAQKLIEAAKQHRFGALFTVALALGLRKGEALGLKWPAIDFERGTLAVRLALQRIKMPGDAKGKLLLREPKRASRRTINLPQVCLSALIEHRARQERERIIAGSRWHDDGFVFTSRIGTPLHLGDLRQGYLQILESAGLPFVRIHDLRHTAATLLLIQGVPARVVMELLGHTQISTTLNLYSHVVPALRKEAAEQMDAALKPAEPLAAPVAMSVAILPPVTRLN